MGSVTRRRYLSYHVHVALRGPAGLGLWMLWMLKMTTDWLLLAVRPGGERESRNFLSIHLSACEVRDRQGTNNFLSEDVFQSFSHINQSMATINQTLTGRSRMGCDLS